MQKSFVVIGSSAGIGRALTEKLLAEGNVVYGFARREATTQHSDYHHMAFDALNFSAEAFQPLPDQISGLAYCPGSITLKPFNRLTETDFSNDFNINVLSAVKVIQALTGKLKTSGEGSIVLFSTVAVQTGMSFHSSISAAKGAVEGLTRSLAAEWAASKIRVNCIAPSLTNTSLASSLLSSPEKIEASDKRHPIGRIGTAEDIAEAALYLITNKSSWVTGQILHVDGGMGNLK